MLLVSTAISLLLMKILLYYSFDKKNNINDRVNYDKTQVPVSIIVPMFNEEETIIKSVHSLMNIVYGEFEIIIVDDGSVDDSLEQCKKVFGHLDKVKIVSQRNSGKATALNKGILYSKNNIIVCIDADTIVSKNILTELVPFFADEKVGAVSGNIMVGNVKNFLTKMQYYEYIYFHNFERQYFDSHNSILVVPGAIGAFRKNALLSVGGFLNDTLTEDADITIRMLIKGYKIKNSVSSSAYTTAPDNFSSLSKQRLRWKYGTLQVLFKNYRNIKKANSRFLSLVFIPYTLIYGTMLPTVSAIVDYVAIKHVLLVNHSFVVFYLFFLMLDAMIILKILKKSDIKQPSVFSVLGQRLCMRQLLLFTNIKIVLGMLCGAKLSWR